MVNPLASLLLATQTNGIRAFLDPLNSFSYQEVIAFFLIWFVFTTLTSGTAAPTGIFMPCILIGCALGHIYGNIVVSIFGQSDSIHVQSYAIIGAAAVLSGNYLSLNNRTQVRPD